jgi:phosphoadenosine phosphosulfate reductase
MSKRSRQRSMIPLDRMVADSIAFIREHEPLEGYFVGFSGGKDSIVSLELTRMAGVKHQTYYSCTGIDPPEVVRFIKVNYPDVTWLYPKRSFWAGIKVNTPPMRVARWCCDQLKKNPAAKIPLKHRIMGLRAEESGARKARGRISTFPSGQVIYKPIFHWLEWHVWDFIDEHQLPYPSLYDEGFGRIGCVVCPFLSRPKMIQHKARWPKQYAIFEKVVREWWDSKTKTPKRGGMIERLGITTSSEFLEAWYRDTKYDHKQPPCSCPSNDCAGITQTEMRE